MGSLKVIIGSILANLGLVKDGHCRSVKESFAFAFLSSSKLKENLTELHIMVRTPGFKLHCYQTSHISC